MNVGMLMVANQNQLSDIVQVVACHWGRWEEEGE